MQKKNGNQDDGWLVLDKGRNKKSHVRPPPLLCPENHPYSEECFDYFAAGRPDATLCVFVPWWFSFSPPGPKAHRTLRSALQKNINISITHKQA